MPLIEDEVIRAVAGWLQADGWEVSYLQGKQRGIDIKALHTTSERRLAIEAKGGPHTRADLSNAACLSVGAAFMTSVAWLGQKKFEGWHVGIALPRSKWFDHHLLRIEHGLMKFPISVFQVSDTGEVDVTWRT